MFFTGIQNIYNGKQGREIMFGSDYVNGFDNVEFDDDGNVTGFGDDNMEVIGVSEVCENTSFGEWSNDVLEGILEDEEINEEVKRKVKLAIMEEKLS